jgi:hypothetical protein
MRIFTFVMVTIGILAGIFACEEEIVPPAPAPDFSIAVFSFPPRINIARPQSYDVAYKVIHPGGLEAVSEVKTLFYGSDQTTVLQEILLYDDGGALHPGDRDVFAGDGIFSNVFVSDSLVFPVGEVFIRAEATDNTQQAVQSQFADIVSLTNLPPVLLSIAAPDTLKSASPPVAFSATVQDSNDISDVFAVAVRLTRNGGVIAIDSLKFTAATSPTEGEFAALFDSTYAAERQGAYVLEFQAIDFNEDVSNILNKPIYLENKAPALRNVMLADTVQRPAIGPDTLVVRITANDPQGLGDITSVTFTVLREGGTPATLDMFDDGDFDGHRDEIAGDGVYSRGVIVNAASVPGTFRFTFETADKVGNPAPAVVDTLVILP